MPGSNEQSFEHAMMEKTLACGVDWSSFKSWLYYLLAEVIGNYFTLLDCLSSSGKVRKAIVSTLDSQFYKLCLHSVLFMRETNRKDSSIHRPQSGPDYSTAPRERAFNAAHFWVLISEDQGEWVMQHTFVVTDLNHSQ